MTEESLMNETPFIHAFTGEIKFYGVPSTCDNVVYCGVLPEDIKELVNNNGIYYIQLVEYNYPDKIVIAEKVYNWINNYIIDNNGTNKQTYKGVPVPYTRIKDKHYNNYTYRIDQPTLFALVNTAYIARGNNTYSVYINRNIKKVLQAKNNRYEKAMHLLGLLLNMNYEKLEILNYKLTNKLYFAK